MNRLRIKGDLRLLLFCLVSLIIGIAIRVNLIFLRKYPAGDEIWVYYLIQSGYRDIWLASFSDLHAPFYFLFLHTLGSIFRFDLSILNLRFISLFFGILGNFATGYLALAVFGKRIGVYAFCLSLFLPAFIWPAIYARYYSFLMLLSVFVTFTFINFLKSGKLKHLLLFTLISTVGVYTHYYFILLVISFGIFLVTFPAYRKFVKKWTLSVFFTSLLSLPALYWLVTLPKPEIAGRHINDLLKIPAILATNLSSWELLLYLYSATSSLVLASFVFLLTVVSVFIIFSLLKNSQNSFNYLFLLNVVVPPLLAAVFAYTIWPVLSLSSLQIFLPALVILISAGLAVHKKETKILASIFAVLILISLVLFFRASEVFSKPQKDAGVIIGDFKKGDIVLHSHIYSYITLRYYLGDAANFGIAPAFSANLLTEKVLGYRRITEEELLNHKGRVWNVKTPYDKREEVEKIQAILVANYHPVKKETFNQGFDRSSFDVYLYERKLPNI